MEKRNVAILRENDFIKILSASETEGEVDIRLTRVEYDPIKKEFRIEYMTQEKRKD